MTKIQKTILKLTSCIMIEYIKQLSKRKTRFKIISFVAEISISANKFFPYLAPSKFIF